MEPFLTALEQEIRQLEEALERDVRFRRLSELKKVQALYRTPSFDIPQPTTNTAHSRNSQTTRPRRRVSPARLRILQKTAEYLEDKWHPVPTKDILTYLLGLGMEIPGDVPSNNLSAILSNSTQFKSHGRTGWTIQPKIDLTEAYSHACEKIISDMEESELKSIQTDMNKGKGPPPDLMERLRSIVEKEANKELTFDEQMALSSIFLEKVNFELL